jgi:predicted CopG family antitoxin
MAKTVKVHEDTHRFLKLVKARKRSRSMDEVIREMIRQATGTPVERAPPRKPATKLTAYLEG